LGSKAFATVSPSIIPHPHPPPIPTPPKGPDANLPPLSVLDSRILKALAIQPQTSLSDIIGHYVDQTGNILNVSLPYESRPSEDRRVSFEGNASSKEIITVAHCAKDGDKHKIALSSGFSLNAPAPREGETLIVTCAHTLEEVGGVSYDGSMFEVDSLIRYGALRWLSPKKYPPKTLPTMY
jgi:hypothetical protein